jgi:hypothetical protein
MYAYYLINRSEYKSNRLLIREIRSNENKRHVRLAFYPVNGYWPSMVYVDTRQNNLVT